MTIEDRLAVIDERTTAILRELRELRAESQHQGGRWSTRAELAQQRGCSLDTVDRESMRPGGSVERRTIGRRVQVRDRPRTTDDQILQLAQEARA